MTFLFQHQPNLNCFLELVSTITPTDITLTESGIEVNLPLASESILKVVEAYRIIYQIEE